MSLQGLFGVSTGITRVDIVSYICLYHGPPIGPGNQVFHLPVAPMSSCRCIMMLVEDLHAQWVLWDVELLATA